MHPDVLDGRTLNLLQRLATADFIHQYVLVGGTGLALSLGHRRSQDLDFFTSNPSTRVGSDAILSALDRMGRYEVLSRQPDQLHLRIDGVRTTFLAYPFRFRYPALEFQRVRVADPRDIAVMKAQAIGRRATARDYVDLALLLDMRVTSINEIITAAKEIFVAEGEAEFSERLFLQQLVYTEDIQDAAEAVALARNPDWTFERVKRVLEKEVQNYLQKTMDPETRGFDL